MNKEELDKLWEWVERVGKEDSIPYDSMYALGSVFGQMRDTIETQQKEIELLGGKGDKIEQMREMLEVQGSNGNWNYDHYMFGLYNGMEYILAMVEDREPEFRRAPAEFLVDVAKIYTGPVGIVKDRE